MIKKPEAQNLLTFKSRLNKTFHSSLQAEIPNRPTSSTGAPAELSHCSWCRDDANTKRNGWLIGSGYQLKFSGQGKFRHVQLLVD
jgi:hypothetical protein